MQRFLAAGIAVGETVAEGNHVCYIRDHVEGRPHVSNGLELEIVHYGHGVSK